MENKDEQLSNVLKKTEALEEQLSEVLEKAAAYEKLDYQFRLICNEGIQGVLQNITKCGLAKKKITEQQALNSLGERFPMTTDQIISTLENQSLPKPVEVPEFVGEYIEKCKRADSGLIWSIRPDRDANDNSAKVYDWLFPNGAVLPNGEYPKPFEPDNLVRPDKVNQIVFARAWLDGYTVIKGPTMHKLKIELPYFSDVVSGEKTFEIRKNDRDYKVGDILILREWEDGEYTGSEYKVKITYITDYAQQDGYVVMGIVPVEEEE